jgi:hypothetical protein
MNPVMWCGQRLTGELRKPITAPCGARHKPEKYPWLTQLLARKPFKVVVVALANKMARIAWALLAKGGTYRVPALAAAA